MDYIIRLETANEHREVENVTREAFWNVFTPGCNEHYLAHTLRQSDSFVPELNFVALDGSRIVGNIMYSTCRVVGTDGKEHEMLTFGPLSVLPSKKSRGIGSYLVRHSIAEATRLGYKGIIIYGWPEYYKRFGFQKAEIFHITGTDGASEALQVLALEKGAFDSMPGVVKLPPVYSVDDTKAEEFDANFSVKEKSEPSNPIS